MVDSSSDFSVIKTTALYLSPIMTRRSTDKFFILLLPINFLLWLGIGTYEMCLGFAPPRGEEKHTLSVPNDVGLILLRCLLNITIYAIVSAVIVISFLFITTALKAKWIVFTAISLIVITIVSCIMLIPWELAIIIAVTLKSHTLLFLIVIIVLTIVYLIYQVTIFICTKETSVSLSAELISKSCEAILHSFKAVLVSLVIAFLSIIILMITINISLSKIFDSLRYAPVRTLSYLDLLRISIFFIGGTYIFNFIWNFGLVAMGDYSANFYAESNNHKSSNIDIFQSVTRVSRYHLGTIAFLSIPIFPSICALTMAFKTNQQLSTKSSYKSINFFSNMCLIIDISDYALVQTSIYGYKSLKSITEMFDLQRRSSLLFLTLNAISTKVIEICVVIATIIGMIIRIFFLPAYHDIPFTRLYEWKSTQYLIEDLMFYEIFVAAIYINFICKLMTRSAMCTFSIYQMSSVRMAETMEEHIAIAEPSSI